MAAPPPPIEAPQTPFAPVPAVRTCAPSRSIVTAAASPDESPEPGLRLMRLMTPPPMAPAPPPMLSATTPWALRPAVATLAPVARSIFTAPP